MLGFDERFQAVQALRPKDAVLIDPGVDSTQGFRVELVNAVSTFAMLADKVRSPQQAQVLGNCRTRNRKGIGDLPCRLRAAAEKIEHRPTSRIGESLKSGLAGSRICNRSVTHNA